MNPTHSFRPAFRSLLAVTCLGVFVSRDPASAEPLNDPIPAHIVKGEIRIELEPVAKGFASPVLLVAFPDASGRLLVVDQAGQLRVIEKGELRAEPFLDVASRLVKLNKDYDERGLLGVAFDPEFTKSGSRGAGRIFTYTSEPKGERSDFPNPHAGGVPSDHQSSVASWTVSADGSRVEPASRKELMRIDEPQSNHNAGMLAFGPDGFLYIALGDGGSANDMGPGHNLEGGNAQDPSVILGKMVRIDVNGTDAANGTYGIPKDNPFASSGGVREIFAMGLRNPFRFSFDGAALLVGDIGQNKVESVHRVVRGGNYGWRIKEGTFKFNTNGTIEAPENLPAGLTDPVFQYDHDEGISVIGGHVYRGKAIPALAGKYVFGDYRSGTKTNTGRLFCGDLANGQITEFRIGKDDRELGFLLKGFGVDAHGEVYVCGSAQPGLRAPGGVVMKIVAAAAK